MVMSARPPNSRNSRTKRGTVVFVRQPNIRRMRFAMQLGGMLLAVALVSAACGATPSPAPAGLQHPTAGPQTTASTHATPPAPAPTPTPLANPTPDPRVATTSHLNESVNTLVGLTDDEDVWSWMHAEAAWLLVDPGATTLADYRASVAEGLASAVDGTDVKSWASQVEAAAIAVPGVSLTATASTHGHKDVYKPGQTATVTANGIPQAKITVSNVKWVHGYPTCCGDMFRPAKGRVYLEFRINFRALTDIDYGLSDWRFYVDGVLQTGKARYEVFPEPVFRRYFSPQGHLKKGRIAAGYILFSVPVRGQVRVAYRTNEFIAEVRKK